MMPADNTTKVMVLSWHSTTDTAVTSGGFRRIIEFVKRVPENFYFHIIDNSPTIFNFSAPRYKVYEYKIAKPFHWILQRNFMLGRFLEWTTSSLKLLTKGNKVLKQEKCDVIYVPTSELLFILLPAVLLRILRKKKLVCDILNLEMPYGSIINFYKQMRSKGYSFWRSLCLPVYIQIECLIIKYSFKKMDCIMSVSEYLADFIRDSGARCYVGFTPSGVDYNFINNIPQMPKIFDGVYVGRHEAEKGIFDLLEVWKDMQRLKPGSRLVMVGPCSKVTKRQIENKLDEYKMKDYVFIKGALSEEEKIKTIKSSKAFIHLGKVEPLVPVITVLEALACGLPVVLYDQPSYREHPEIYHHISFALVPLEDYSAAADRMVFFMDVNGSTREAIVRQAKEYAKRFDWESISQMEYAAIRQITFNYKEEKI